MRCCSHFVPSYSTLLKTIPLVVFLVFLPALCGIAGKIVAADAGVAACVLPTLAVDLLVLSLIQRRKRIFASCHEVYKQKKERKSIAVFFFFF